MNYEKEQIELRKVCCDKLKEFLNKDSKVVLLDADLMGSLGSASLKKEFNDRVINCGIMEAQEISSASGMRLAGMKPFVHTFTAFASRRCLDQIFMSSLYQNNPITIIASDAGIQAVHNGGTHMSFDDMGILRSLANTTIIEPTDSYVLSSVLDEIYSNNNKFYYLRLTRKTVTKIYNENEKFEIGKAKVLCEGSDILIIAMGLMVKEALVARDMLKEKGISATVIDMFTLKPIDRESIIKHSINKKLVITAENHSILNGLGSAVAEVLSEENPTKLIRIGIKEKFGQVGTLEYLQEVYELRAIDIVKKVEEELYKK